MSDANWTIGHTERMAVLIYQRSDRMVSYKNVNHVDFVNTIEYIMYLYSGVSIS